MDGLVLLPTAAVAAAVAKLQVETTTKETTKKTKTMEISVDRMDSSTLLYCRCRCYNNNISKRAQDEERRRRRRTFSRMDAVGETETDRDRERGKKVIIKDYYHMERKKHRALKQRLMQCWPELSSRRPRLYVYISYLFGRYIFMCVPSRPPPPCLPFIPLSLSLSLSLHPSSTVVCCCFHRFYCTQRERQ